MDARNRKKLIDQYKDGYRVVAEALAGATAEDLDARPAPGTRGAKPGRLARDRGPSAQAHQRVRRWRPGTFVAT